MFRHAHLKLLYRFSFEQRHSKHRNRILTTLRPSFTLGSIVKELIDQDHVIFN